MEDNESGRNSLIEGIKQEYPNVIKDEEGYHLGNMTIFSYPEIESVKNDSDSETVAVEGEKKEQRRETRRAERTPQKKEDVITKRMLLSLAGVLLIASLSIYTILGNTSKNISETLQEEENISENGSRESSDSENSKMISMITELEQGTFSLEEKEKLERERKMILSNLDTLIEEYKKIIGKEGETQTLQKIKKELINCKTCEMMEKRKKYILTYYPDLIR